MLPTAKRHIVPEYPVESEERSPFEDLLIEARYDVVKKPTPSAKKAKPAEPDHPATELVAGISGILMILFVVIVTVHGLVTQGIDMGLMQGLFYFMFSVALMLPAAVLAAPACLVTLPWMSLRNSFLLWRSGFHGLLLLGLFIVFCFDIKPLPFF